MTDRHPQKNTPSAAVLALAQAAALAVPGVASAEMNAEYLYSWYREADIPGSRTGNGQSQERYDIRSHLVRLVGPWKDKNLGLNLMYETLSGASPWFVMAGPDGRPLQVMSGASIREERIAADGSVSFAIPGGTAAVTLGTSDEDDYRSFSGGGEVEFTDPEKSWTWSLGGRYSNDRIEPTQGGRQTPSVRKEDKESLNAYAGVSRVLSPRTVVQGGLSAMLADGYLSDPYKLVQVQSTGSLMPDSRPDQRLGWAAVTKLRHHVEQADAALHADYRYYVDDWDIHSHTLELTWHQNVGDSWRVSPGLRWYSQSQAEFYAPYFATPPADGYASSDYRLSPFGALSGRLDVTKTLGDFAVGGGAEYYEADGRYAVDSVDVESPGLVEYWSFHARLSYQF